MAFDYKTLRKCECGAYPSWVTGQYDGRTFDTWACLPCKKFAHSDHTKENRDWNKRNYMEMKHYVFEKELEKPYEAKLKGLALFVKLQEEVTNA